MRYSNHPKRILIAGHDATTATFNQQLLKEGFQIIQTHQIQETQIEWWTENCCAGIIMTDDHLDPILNSAISIYRHNIPRPIIYKTLSKATATVDNGLVFPVPKDISPDILLALLRALLRRINNYPDEWRYAGFGLDQPRRKISHWGRPLSLSQKQFNLLAILIKYSGQLVTARDLHELLWPGNSYDSTRLAAQITLLRNFLKKKKIPVIIKNYRKHGYFMVLRTTMKETTSENSGASRRYFTPKSWDLI